MSVTAFSPQLLSRVEDACLNASVPPQQLWVDGWMVRYCPGKARRARSVNAVAEGLMLLPDRVEAAAGIAWGFALIARRGLPAMGEVCELGDCPQLAEFFCEVRVGQRHGVDVRETARTLGHAERRQ